MVTLKQTICSTILLLAATMMPWSALAKDEKTTRAQKRSREIIELFTNLEKGVFGERDLKRAERLLKRASNVDRPWLVMAIAQYYRQMEKDPVRGLRALAPETLETARAKEWLQALKAAEQQKLKEWRQAKIQALQDRTDAPAKPTGLALDFPAAEIKATELNVQLALEVARCLAALGKVQTALKLIDSQGRTFVGDGLVLSYECLGDLQLRMRLFDKSIQAYKSGIKFLHEFKNTEGFSEWQKVIRARLETKLAEANRLWDIERYGLGWVIYRAAEQKRRRDHLYLEAIWLYDQLTQKHAESIYGEAAKCYLVKCHLTLARLKYAGKRERDSIRRFEEKLTQERAFYGIAKRCRVPAAALEEIKQKVDEYEARVAYLKNIPYGKKALKRAKELARVTVKENPWGLYVGEILADVATYAFTIELDPRESEEHYRKAWEWLTRATKMDDAVREFSIPSKAVKVATPQKAVIKRDLWGNITRQVSPIGAVVNRRTAEWYINELCAKTVKALGFLSFYRGEKEEALQFYRQILKYDEKSRAHARAGQWNDYRRLVWGAEHGYLYAYPQELEHFKNRQRFALLIADFFYCTERNQEALSLVDRLLSKEFGNLSQVQTMYVRLLKGSVLYRHEGRPAAFAEFEAALKENTKTCFTRDRLMLLTANTSYYLTGKAALRGHTYMTQLAHSTHQNDYVYGARISLGLRFMRSGKIKQGHAMLTNFPKSATKYRKLGAFYYKEELAKLERKKGKEQ